MWENYALKINHYTLSLAVLINEIINVNIQIAESFVLYDCPINNIRKIKNYSLLEL